MHRFRSSGSSCSLGAWSWRASVEPERLSRAERTVLVVTAGLALWNLAVAYLAGLALYHATTRGLVRLG